jgi:NDP-sugar pyrophosphorylase family protein
MKCKAMILAAGFGTRLQDVEKLPKPLVKIYNDISIIDNVIDLISKEGITEIAVNLHYEKDLIRHHLSNKYKNVEWIFFEEQPEILGTGGGILNAKDFFTDTYGLVINSDILCFPNLNKHIKSHIASNAIVSLLVKPSGNGIPHALSYNDKEGLTAFLSKEGKPFYNMPSPAPDDFFGNFTGIQIFHKQLFDFFEDKSGFFSITDIYARMTKNNQKVNIISIGKEYWKDVGTPETLEEGRDEFKAIINCCDLKDISHIERLFKGASSKTTLRIHYKTQDKKPEILSISDDLNEIEGIMAFSDFFKDTAFHVPQIINKSSNEKQNFLLMEDGGTLSLHEFYKTRRFNTEIISKYTKRSVDLLIALANIKFDNFPYEYGVRKNFDYENILFDINYYNSNYCMERDIPLKENKIEALANEIHNIFKYNLPKVIMHRDFQTTNILIEEKTEKLTIIDLQTMRLGYSFYDLASLLLDSYASINDNTIESMLDYFMQELNYDKKLKEIFWVAALIRKIQNLGCFSLMGKSDGFFMTQILPAERDLKYIKEKMNKTEYKTLLNYFN